MADVTLPWMRTLWMQWVHANNGQGLPHALGVPWQPTAGSEQMLDALTSWLLCSKSGNSACGNCKFCLLHLAGNHPDYMQIAPEDEKKIGIDQIRNMQEKVWSRSSQSGAKVILIQNAEKLTEAASNALLKVLEEPPESTYIVVAPERFSRLLPTIRSRLTLFPLPIPNYKELIEWFQLHAGVDISDEKTLSEAQFHPLKVLKRVSETGAQRMSVYQQLLSGQVPEHPDKGIALEQWLDEFAMELQLEWKNEVTADGSEFESDILSWYHRALAIKEQAQMGGVNASILIDALFSDIAMKRFQ